MRILAFVSLIALSGVAFADSYQVTFGWNAPTWLPTDAPAYSAKYRIAGGTAVDISGLTTPGGTFNYTAAPASLLEMCPQSRNGATIVVPDCSQPSHWVSIGASPVPLTVPPMPSGFSATIIRTGP